MKNDQTSGQAPDDDGPPTLPLPSAWRLVVAAIAVLGVLYMMYETARDAEEPPPPSPASSVIGGSTS